ncbi:casein kinase substrate phosphoprotein PP28 domain-containing protein [Sarocladium implicatum]|nr:casein kinase substrate phosphoprotein PP28 domain-containing protein [Sarocladium implicatum]
MPAGAPGSSSRGRGGKFKKYTRGGGKHFSRDLQPVDSDGNQISMWAKDGQKNGGDESSEEESSEEDSDEDSDEGAGPSKEEDEAATREARKQQKKARKEAAIKKAQAKTVEVGDLPSSDESESEDEDMPANPNHSKAARKQAIKPLDDEVDDLADGVAKIQAGNRKEREALEAAAAKERYMKLQAQGKTDESKADLARLKVIREQRAAEAARRQAEKEEKEEQDKARRAEIEAREAKKREAAAGPKKGKKKA